MADPGTSVAVTVSSELGGTWFLVREENEWHLKKDFTGALNSEVILDPVTARNLFTKSITASEAEEFIAIKGDKELGTHALTMISIMG